MTPKQVATILDKIERYGHANVKKDFKALADGKADDIGRIEEAVDFVQNHAAQAELFFTDGLFRTTRPWNIGGQSISPEDALLYEANVTHGGAPSFKLDEHTKSARTLPVSMKFGTRAYIFGDFPAEELTPIISYGCGAHQHGGNSTQSTFITGLKVFGRNGMDHTKGGEGTKHVGLLMTGGDDITLQGCRFYGLEEGLIHNVTYNSLFLNIRFNNCKRGMMTLGSHGSTGTLFKADHCGIAYEIMSGSTTWQQMNTEQCKRGLQIGSSQVVVNGGYLEQNDEHVSTGDKDYQLTIGYSNSHSFGQQIPIENVTVNNMTIAVKNAPHQCVLIEDSVKACMINDIPGYTTNHYTNPDTKIESEASFNFKPPIQ